MGLEILFGSKKPTNNVLGSTYSNLPLCLNPASKAPTKEGMSPPQSPTTTYLAPPPSHVPLVSANGGSAGSARRRSVVDVKINHRRTPSHSRPLPSPTTPQTPTQQHSPERQLPQGPGNANKLGAFLSLICFSRWLAFIKLKGLLVGLLCGMLVMLFVMIRHGDGLFDTVHHEEGIEQDQVALEHSKEESRAPTANPPSNRILDETADNAGLKRLRNKKGKSRPIKPGSKRKSSIKDNSNPLPPPPPPSSFQDCYKSALAVVEKAFKSRKGDYPYVNKGDLNKLLTPLHECRDKRAAANKANRTPTSADRNAASSSSISLDEEYMTIPSASAGNPFCPKISDKVIFLIMGSSVNVRKAYWQDRSWLKRIPKQNVFIFSDAGEPGLERVLTLPEIAGKPSKIDAQFRQLHGMRWLLRERPDIVARGEWFVFADDDTFVDIPSLAGLLGSLPYPDLFLALGRVVHNGLGQDQWFLSGGAGIALSRKAFTSLSSTILTPQCPFAEANDVTFARCLRKLNGNVVSIPGFNPSVYHLGSKEKEFFTNQDNLEWELVEKWVHRRRELGAGRRRQRSVPLDGEPQGDFEGDRERGENGENGEEEEMDRGNLVQLREEVEEYRSSVSEQIATFASQHTFHYVNDWASVVALERWTDFVWDTDCGIDGEEEYV
ncbi:hypothetical protein HK102_011766 [Quaeritorhiza haematococci]|nr:hypothetical protein HK102_011766 [Quaeritorhiza haematococci]